MSVQAGESGEVVLMEIHEAEAASSNVLVLSGHFLAQKLGVPPQAVSSTAACGPKSPDCPRVKPVPPQAFRCKYFAWEYSSPSACAWEEH